MVSMMTQKPEPILAIDIGGTTVKYGVWAAENLTHKNRFNTPKTWPELLDKLIAVKRELALPFAGVAVSLPGGVDTVVGKISGTSAVDYLNEFPIKATLRTALGVPVSIQNDANCAALAEAWWGNAKDVDDAIYMIIGTGIGGAMTINGQLMAGQDNFTGEFGYMVMNPAGETFSQLASPVKMAARYQRLKELSTAFTAQDVFDLANNGDTIAQQCVGEMLNWLSIGTFNLYVSLNPQRLLIGGGISARPGFVADLQQRIQHLMHQHKAALTADVRACRFLNDANLIGAVRQFYVENGDEPAAGAVRMEVR